MKISSMKWMLVSLITAGSFAAKAGLLLEPYLGYQSTTVDAEYVGGTDAGGKNTSTALGLRLGYKLPVMFWVAADYNMSMGGKFASDDTTVVGDADFDQSHLYLDVGVDLPILLRAWFGYGIMNTAKYKFSSGDNTLSEGSSYKLGAGFTGLPFVSINLEYIVDSPNKFESSSNSGLNFDDVFSSYKNSGLLLSVSMPFNL